MYFLSYIHFFCSIVYLFLAIFVLTKNSRALFNRVCSLTLFCFCIWSFGVTFVHNPSVSKGTAVLFENIGAIGWINFSSFFLWFSIIFIGKKRISRSKFFIISMFIIPLILLYKQWNHYLLYDHKLQSYGWVAPWSLSTWTYIFWSYYFITSLTGLYLIFDFSKKTGEEFKKRQAGIILGTGLIPLFLGTISNVIMRLLHIYNFPPIGDIFVLIWAFGIAYAISKYKLLSITPTIAADQIISTMKDFLILLNPRGKIVSVNKAVSDSLGYEDEELEGSSLEVLFTDNAKPDIIQKITRKEKQKNLGLYLKTKKGRQIPVSLTTSEIPGYGIVCIARDITMQKEHEDSLMKDKNVLEARVEERTKELSIANEGLIQEILERKKTEDELKESEERLKILFEFAPDAYYMNDFAGTFIDGNKKAEELTGYQKKELIGKSFLKLKLLPASQIPKAAQALTKNALGHPTGPDQFVLNRKDGSKVHVEISTYPIKIKNKKVVLGIARDISQRKRDEEEKSNLEEQLFQAQKMEAIGQLAGGIAHDFNNMLGAISGYAEMIKRKFTKNNPTLEKYITRVLDAAVRSADLTSKLLAFARKGRYEIVAVNIHETIQEVINLLEHIIHGRIKINMHCNASPATVMGDTSQLQNAILNIAVNAFDAMPDGGVLTFTTSIFKLDEKFISTRPYKIIPGKYLRISIADTGSGMGKEIKARVFEPFFTTKELGKGTGLGLASTYGIIKNHDGYIDVESKKGEGTEFTLYLPSVDKPSKKTVTVSEKPTKGKGTILVIDDEELIREIIKDILDELGYTTITCNDGEQAIDYYKKHHKEIELVIWPFGVF